MNFETDEQTDEQYLTSQIDGGFTGWSGKTLYQLVSGDIWQQVQYSYSYHYAYRPTAIIFKRGNAFFMEVDGSNEAVEVRHPPQSGWLDELGRLKGGRAMGLGVARCAP